MRPSVPVVGWAPQVATPSQPASPAAACPPAPATPHAAHRARPADQPPPWLDSPSAGQPFLFIRAGDAAMGMGRPACVCNPKRISCISLLANSSTGVRRRYRFNVVVSGADADNATSPTQAPGRSQYVPSANGTLRPLLQLSSSRLPQDPVSTKATVAQGEVRHTAGGNVCAREDTYMYHESRVTCMESCVWLHARRMGGA